MPPLTKEEKQEIAELVAEGIKLSGALEPIQKFKPGEDPNDPPPGDKPTFKSLGEQLMAVAKVETHRQVDPRLAEMKQTGLSEGIPSEGGFLVQQEFIPTLVERMYETGEVASRCYRQPVGAQFNGIKMPRIDESSRADGSRWGGVRAYWESEGGTKTPARPKFGQVSLELQKLIGLCYVTDELLQDATALESYIRKWFALEMGFKLDDALINGDGSGKPLGLISGPSTVSVAKESGQAADTVVTENVLKMWRRLWAPCRKNAIWFINQDIETQLELLTVAVGTGGALMNLYDPPGSRTNGGPNGMIKGRPVLPIEQCATLGDTGDVILADMSQYILIDKGGMDFATSIHVQFTTDETAFRFVYRVNGQPLWQSALTPFKGSDTQSPFIKLDARA